VSAFLPGSEARDELWQHKLFLSPRPIVSVD
jgi:hypothetical protein